MMYCLLYIFPYLICQVLFKIFFICVHEGYWLVVFVFCLFNVFIDFESRQCLYIWKNFTECFHKMTPLWFLRKLSSIYFLIYNLPVTISFQYALLCFTCLGSLNLAYRFTVFNPIHIIFILRDLWIGLN